MESVIADVSTGRYLLTAAAQKLPQGRGKSAGWGPGGIFRLSGNEPEPMLPDAPGWVRLRPELSGVCGSDIGAAHPKLSLVMSAIYRSARQVPGHEIVAVVDQLGPGVTGLTEGDRVVVDPVMGCAIRGFDPVCRACRDGAPGVCERGSEPGITGHAAPCLGYDSPLGGGWAQQLVAHESQLYPVGSIPSRRAVLAEPAAIGLHSALRWKRTGERAVVIGSGTIGLMTTAALRMLYPDLDVIVLSDNDFGTAQALGAGATRVLRSGPAAVEALAETDGGGLLWARMTKTPILQRGVDAVFDCVGSSDTIDLALHLLRTTGTLVLIGAAGKQPVDWSLVWTRSITVAGTVMTGPEPALGRTSFSQVVEWLSDDAYPVDAIVTHTFPLEQWRTAMQTASAGPAAGCVKATLRPNPDIPLVTRAGGFERAEELVG